MSIVFAGAGSHAPEITAWTAQAPEKQVGHIFGGYAELGRELAAANPDTILLLTSEHWANFFLDHTSAFCIGRAEAFEGPVEPWLRVPKSRVKGDPALAQKILEGCYAGGFELSFAQEMKLDHGSMVPLHFLTPDMDRRVVPLMFNTLVEPRPSPARCLALGKTLAPILESCSERIAIVATGGLSHDPGERNHGRIDVDFDARFLEAITTADLDALSRYMDSDLMQGGGGTPELLAWICLAGIMGRRKARVLTYEPVVPWATGIGIISYANAA